ncbi:MAG: hypothetical protein ACRBB4_04990 [Neptuniibacter sp.]
MLKVFSELKSNSPQLFSECVAQASATPGAEGWLVLRTWGELANTAKFMAAHQFEIDSNKIRSQLTPIEFTFVTGLVNTNRASHIEARKSQHKVYVQKSERFVKWFIENNEALLELEKLKTKVAGRRMPSQASDEWSKIAASLTT